MTGGDTSVRPLLPRRHNVKSASVGDLVYDGFQCSFCILQHLAIMLELAEAESGKRFSRKSE
jgi:hypothetical protein